jgi:LysM repeat protein
MKFSDLSVKRRPAKKPVFRKLFANVRRKQQNVAVAAPMPEDGDVPNIGIARALVVILIIHVVAIAGIFAHSKWFEKDTGDGKNAMVIEPARQLRDAGEKLPKIDKTDEPYQPKAGESYASIARDKGVNEQDLREANNNVEIRPSRILRIPQSIKALEPEEIARVRDGNGTVLVGETSADDTPNEEAAPKPTPAVAKGDIRTEAPMVETAAAANGTVFKPRVHRDSPAQTPVATQASPSEKQAKQALPAANRKYTVTSGDTFYKIAKEYKTKPDVVMKTNGITDPRKLKIGMQLMVP